MKPLSRAIIGGITALTLSLILSGCADRPGEPEISRTASVPAPTTAAPLPPLNAEEAARAYADALARFDSAESLSYLCHTKIGLDDGRGFAYVTMETLLFLKRQDGALRQLDATMSFGSDAGSRLLIRHYDAASGRIEDREGAETTGYQALDARQATAGMGILFPYRLSADAIRDMTCTRQEDGSILLQGVVPSSRLGEERAEEFLDAAFSAFDLSEDFLGDYTLKAATVSATINEEGQLTAFSSSYEATIPGAAGDLPMRFEGRIS